MDAFTPAQTTELMSRIGCKKAKMRLDKLWFNSIFGGMLLGFGCSLSLISETAPWFTTNAPGLIRVIGACFFPVGLIMIVLTGADLITSNIMFMATAVLNRRCTIKDLAINWVFSFFGNLAGMLFFTFILQAYAGTWDAEPYRSTAIKFSTTKAVTPEWHQIFLRGIGCNWLVCMAVFLGISAREIFSKIVAIWLPVMTFVALGMDHVVANMYFIPLGIWLGNPEITVGYYIYKSLIPSLIGNIVGGVLFMSLPYWYFYLSGSEGVHIHFDLNPIKTAMEVGGPMENHHRGPSTVTHASSERNDQLPDSKSDAQSGLAEELSAEKYGKYKPLNSAA
ncbi:Formate/nitrite transporter [Xylariaceae sp. FL0804]|nr:Formate/nitrite transporter [Xylariaceae sp. FL0804]